MRKRIRFRRAVRPSPAEALSREHDAYRLLEEARLRCLQLREEVRSEARRRLLREAYRELGLAGYLASSRIPSAPRLELLAAAHAAGAEAAGEAHGARALLAVVASAATAVEAALVAPGVTDHVQQAAEHLARARRELTEALSASAAAMPAELPSGRPVAG
jgi:hypothetical protein